VRQAWRAAPYRGVARAVEGDPAAAWVVGVAEVRGGKELEAPQHDDGDDGQFLHHGPRPRRRVDVGVDGALPARRLLRPSAPRGGCSRWAALEAPAGKRLSRGVHDASGGFGSERKRWWKWDEVVAVLVGSKAREISRRGGVLGLKRRGSYDARRGIFFSFRNFMGIGPGGPTCIEINGWCVQRQQRAELWTWALWL
jgi:hypothetical protein